MKPIHLAAALFCALAASTTALAQTQPLPSALGSSGSYTQNTPVTPCVAPAGGGLGPCRYVSEDRGLPTTSSPSSSSAIGIAPVASTVAEACHVFKASPGNLYGVSGYIGAPGWIMVLDATSAPADGAVTPKAWAYAASAGSWSINYGVVPAVMATGITVCVSSTGPLTKTAFSTNTTFSGRVQ